MSAIIYQTFENTVRALNRVLRDNLAVPPELILNSESVHGATAYQQNVDELISPDLDQPFVVFDLAEDSQSDYYGATGTVNGMDVMTPYLFHVKLYGNACHDLSARVLGLFRNQKICSDLLLQGIYIKSVDAVGSVKEFINNVLWPRCDLTVGLYIIQSVEIQQEQPICDYSSITYNHF